MEYLNLGLIIPLYVIVVLLFYGANKDVDDERRTPSVEQLPSAVGFFIQPRGDDEE